MIRSLFGGAIVAASLAGCSQVQMFTAGDLANATALAIAGADAPGAACWNGLVPAAAASPDPADDGVAVLAERKRLLAQAVSGPCGAIIAPAILQAIGKAVPAPFSLALPF